VTLKLAISDYSFPKLEWDQALRLARDLGFGALDIGLFAGRSHLRPEDVFRHPSQSAARAVRALQAHELEIADVFGQPGTAFHEKALNHPEPAVRERAAEFYWRLLEFAARCNARHMTLLPGIHFKQESYDDSLRRSADELAWRIESAAKLGIVCSAELHLDSVASTPLQAKRLLQLTPGLTLTLDYTHFTYQGISDDEIEPLIASASHFHARGGCKGKLQAVSRENSIDYPHILRVTDQVGYGGYVVVEYVWTEWMGCNEADILTETIWLRDLLKAAAKEIGTHLRGE
jgi:sugar phosphate isomerase/epimerase